MLVWKTWNTGSNPVTTTINELLTVVEKQCFEIFMYSIITNIQFKLGSRSAVRTGELLPFKV